MIFLAIFDQTGNRTKFKFVLPPENLQFRESGHSAVRIQDFAKYPHGRQAGQTDQIQNSLGMAGSLQHSAGTPQQRVYMAGGVKIIKR